MGANVLKYHLYKNLFRLTEKIQVLIRGFLLYLCIDSCNIFLNVFQRYHGNKEVLKVSLKVA